MSALAVLALVWFPAVAGLVLEFSANNRTPFTVYQWLAYRLRLRTTI